MKYKHKHVLLLVIAFVWTTAFPGKVLAFVDYAGMSDRSLVFVRDQSVASGSNITVAKALQQPSMQVRRTLVQGDEVRVIMTAYSSTAGQTQGDPFITASGKRVGSGIMAANFLPLGTQVEVDGRVYTVWDRLHSRYNEKYIVDVWMPSRAQALEFGVRMGHMKIVSLP